MKVQIKQLREALEIVKPGLANKELAIEQATSFAFMDGRVVTYNDEISVSHPVEGLKDLQGAIDADLLYPFLGKLKTEEVDMDLNEKSELIIKSGKSKAGFLLQADIKLPLDQEVSEKGKWKALPENFIDRVSFVMHAAGSGHAKPILTCVHVNKEGYVEASDGYRIAHYDLPSEMPVATFLMPVDSAVNLAKLKPVRIAEGKGWIHFRTADNTIFSCRILEDPYVNTAPHMIVTGKRITFPEEINGMLDRAMVFAEREKKTMEKVIISISKNVLQINSDSDIGWFEESADIKYKEEDIKFNVTPYLLKRILTITQSCIVGNKMLKFEGEGWVYTSLLREK